MDSLIDMSKPAIRDVTTLLRELAVETTKHEKSWRRSYTRGCGDRCPLSASGVTDHTLRARGLDHEVHLRLFGQEHVNWQNRAHFFAAVAREMRHLLVDYARARNAKKHSDGNVRISLSDVHATADARDEDLVALNEALSRLERIDPRASQVVELRFFTGLSERETAEVLEISISR